MRELVVGHDPALDSLEPTELDLAGPVVDDRRLVVVELLEARGVRQALGHHGQGRDAGDADDAQHDERRDHERTEQPEEPDREPPALRGPAPRTGPERSAPGRAGHAQRVRRTAGAGA